MKTITCFYHAAIEAFDGDKVRTICGCDDDSVLSHVEFVEFNLPEKPNGQTFHLISRLAGLKY